MSNDTIQRVPMTLPGTRHVIYVAQENVDSYLDLGWKKARIRTESGSIPTQNRN